MKINKNLNRDDVYYNVYKVVSLINEWNMPDLDLRIFGELLNRYDYLKHKYDDQDTISTLILTKEIKTRLISKLGTSYNSFMNSITKLRKLGLIDKRAVPLRKFSFLNAKEHCNFTIQFYYGRKTETGKKD
jgi:hypothetical protein